MRVVRTRYSRDLGIKRLSHVHANLVRAQHAVDMRTVELVTFTNRKYASVVRIARCEPSKVLQRLDNLFPITRVQTRHVLCSTAQASGAGHTDSEQDFSPWMDSATLWAACSVYARGCMRSKGCKSMFYIFMQLYTCVTSALQLCAAVSLFHSKDSSATQCFTTRRFPLLTRAGQQFPRCSCTQAQCQGCHVTAHMGGESVSSALERRGEGDAHPR